MKEYKIRAKWNLQATGKKVLNTTKIWKPLMARDFPQADEIHHKKVLNVTKG